MTTGSGEKENNWRSLDQAYGSVARYFQITVHDVIACLRYKRKRNKGVHRDQKIKNYVNKNHPLYYGQLPSFMDFARSEDLQSQFDNQGERNIIQRIYRDHIE